MNQSSKALCNHVEEFEAAADVRQLGSAVKEAARQLVGASSMCFLPFSGRVSSMAEATLFHERYTADVMAGALVSNLPITETELGDGRHSALERLFRTQRPAIDLNAMFRLEGLEAKTVFNEFWRPYQIERQLFVPLVAAGTPLGYLCLGRAMSEPQFRARDLERAAWLGERATATLQRLRRLRAGWCEDLLEALRALPVACALFDATPSLLWLSSAAEQALELSPVATSYTHVVKPTVGLRTWYAAAQRALSCGCSIIQEDDLLLRLVKNQHGDVVFVTRTGSSPASQHRVERMRARWTLTMREAEVLQGLAKGASNKEIAGNLGCSFRTVEAHVSSLLRKSGCASRAELLAQLWA